MTASTRNPYTTLRFTIAGEPDLFIDTTDCPRGIPLFSHWNRDGSCSCPPGTPKVRHTRGRPAPAPIHLPARPEPSPGATAPDPATPRPLTPAQKAWETRRARQAAMA